MKHHLLFTGSGPVVIVHSYSDIFEPKLIAKLAAKGIVKFIAFELNGDELKKTYGNRYDLVVEDLGDEQDLRLLDYDGHRILNHFDFEILKKQKPFFHG